MNSVRAYFCIHVRSSIYKQMLRVLATCVFSLVCSLDPFRHGRMQCTFRDGCCDKGGGQRGLDSEAVSSVLVGLDA